VATLTTPSVQEPTSINPTACRFVVRIVLKFWSHGAAARSAMLLALKGPDASATLETVQPTRRLATIRAEFRRISHPNDPTGYRTGRTPSTRSDRLDPRQGRPRTMAPTRQAAAIQVGGLPAFLD